MAFWGLEILPGKPMPLNLTRRLVVKQAALVVSKPAKKTEPCVLSVSVAEDEQRYVVCRLHEGVLEQCPMELPFSPGDEAQVHLSGGHAVHLTGFLELDDEDDMEDMDGELDELDEESSDEALSKFGPETPSRWKKVAEEVMTSTSVIWLPRKRPNLSTDAIVR
ncbi:hypothetical protein EMIHUDRAFT_460669 [Emiliania huxleyi CCMP1516]|uniref:Nucleoplasmin-like domain-containing protein n=2 Tax=Emiliania huxleyi TaxID=2903 RepID=A0A0D3K9B2_EMIH1|nr:hypothetical protein EMIHUDRAFT_460669 [Emiliania huxleyi CCMP1516]EOD32347.1 hypothetical protein EMIHUDRAFT_460669 [Emiliania huxleyi CCMP1516]|eukprot:XP_005784776.1 hypothetical protein EMIHUDRAFT_460669 [Emiliania huxleyi CCMP1516]